MSENQSIRGHIPASDAVIADLPGIRGVSDTVYHRDVEVPRSPCRAAKDPRVRRHMMSTRALDWSDQLQSFSGPIATDLLAIVQALCPHDWVTEETYRSVVLEMDRNSTFAQTLLAEFDSLVCDFKDVPSKMSVEDLTRCLVEVETNPFFRQLLGMTIRYLYDDPVVWSGCGYEGVAGCTEGKPREDIGDADWLPDPQATKGSRR